MLKTISKTKPPFARITVLLMVTILEACLAGRADAEASPREQLALDQGWRFHLGDIPMPALKTHDEAYHNAKAGKAWGAAAPEYNDADWRKLDLPHDWAVEGPFDEKEN